MALFAFPSVDQQLLKRLSSGDAKAFTEVFDRYWKSVYATCYRYTQSHFDAEDISQEVFRKFWEKRATLDIRGPLENYLVRSAKYAVINHFRDQQTQKRHESLLVAGIPQAELGAAPRYTEAEKKLSDLVACLPPSCRQVYHLKHNHSLTNQAIADRLGLSIKTVEYHLQRANTQLREKLLQLTDFF